MTWIKEECEKEIRDILRVSSITDISTERLKTFDDKEFCEELDQICPVISVVLKIASGELPETRERFGHRVMCYGILYKARFGSSRPSVLAHRNDQLFLAAGVKKKAFKWFNKLGVTNSYTTAHNKHKTLAENFDDEFLRWKKDIEDGKMLEYQVINDLSNCVYNTQKIRKVSYLQKKERRYNIYEIFWFIIQIVGDNLDFECHSRHQGINRHNKTLHWFHLMGIKERLHSSQGTIVFYFLNFKKSRGKALKTITYTFVKKIKKNSYAFFRVLYRSQKIVENSEQV